MSQADTVTTTRQVSNGENDITTSVEVPAGTRGCQRPDMVDYISIGVIALIVIVGIIGFIKSVSSRKYYRCPECGESFRSENMTSMTCKVCGANLEETADANVNDKTK